MARAFLFLLAALLASAHCAYAYDLVLSEPEEDFKTEGGSVRRWDPSGALQCAGMDAVDFTLEPGGLALPKYQNQPALSYVLEGELLMYNVCEGKRRTEEGSEDKIQTEACVLEGEVSVLGHWKGETR
jgi:hypothetical protein